MTIFLEAVVPMAPAQILIAMAMTAIMFATFMEL